MESKRTLRKLLSGNGAILLTGQMDNYHKQGKMLQSQEPGRWCLMQTLLYSINSLLTVTLHSMILNHLLIYKQKQSGSEQVRFKLDLQVNLIRIKPKLLSMDNSEIGHCLSMNISKLLARFLPSRIQSSYSVKYQGLSGLGFLLLQTKDQIKYRSLLQMIGRLMMKLSLDLPGRFGIKLKDLP